MNHISIQYQKKMITTNLKLNADRFTGEKYVDLYNYVRPSPPIQIIHQSLNYLNKTKAETIIDLGCGTGVSTKIWSDFGNEIIGIEPSEEMISIAKKTTKESNIKYQKGYAYETHLPTKSVDIIACSQSFHWMNPTAL